MLKAILSFFFCINPPTNQIDDSYRQNRECSICLEEVADNSHTLPCSHNFHENCINSWLESSNNCPNCRASVNGSNSAASSSSRRSLTIVIPSVNLESEAADAVEDNSRQRAVAEGGSEGYYNDELLMNNGLSIQRYLREPRENYSPILPQWVLDRYPYHITIIAEYSEENFYPRIYPDSEGQITFFTRVLEPLRGRSDLADDLAANGDLSGMYIYWKNNDRLHDIITIKKKRDSL